MLDRKIFLSYVNDYNLEIYLLRNFLKQEMINCLSSEKISQFTLISQKFLQNCCLYILFTAIIDHPMSYFFFYLVQTVILSDQVFLCPAAYPIQLFLLQLNLFTHKSLQSHSLNELVEMVYYFRVMRVCLRINCKQMLRLNTQISSTRFVLVLQQIVNDMLVHL